MWTYERQPNKYNRNKKSKWWLPNIKINAVHQFPLVASPSCCSSIYSIWFCENGFFFVQFRWCDVKCFHHIVAVAEWQLLLLLLSAPSSSLLHFNNHIENYWRAPAIYIISKHYLANIYICGVCVSVKSSEKVPNNFIFGFVHAYNNHSDNCFSVFSLPLQHYV